MTRFNGSILGAPRGSNSQSASGVWSVNNVGIARLSDAWPVVTSALNFGYTSGAGPTNNTIDKFSFSADGNAVDVGDLLVPRRIGLAGASSAGFGYTSGGLNAPGTTLMNTVDRFPFAVDTNASDVGDLSSLRRELAGQNSDTDGYTSGGFSTPGTSSTRVATIDRFPFATNSNATNIGSITQGRYGPAGQSSTVSGYTSGGNPPSGSDSNIIDKFPFASGGNATDVGDLSGGSRGGRRLAGQSSSTHGYVTSGNQARIDKFSFASNGNASNIGTTLNSGGGYGATGQSSQTNGYNTGGGSTNVIQKFPFATDANATDVGDLTVGRYGAAGQQG